MRRKRGGRVAGRREVRRLFRQASVFCRAWARRMQMCGLCFGVGEAEETENAPGVFCTVGAGRDFGVVFSGGRRNSTEGAVLGEGEEKWRRALVSRSSGTGGLSAAKASAKESAKESERRSQSPHRLSDRAEAAARDVRGASRGAVEENRLPCAGRARHRAGKGLVSRAACSPSGSRSGEHAELRRHSGTEEKRAPRMTWGLRHRARKSAASVTDCAGKARQRLSDRANALRSHVFAGLAADRKKALPESRQGLFDASETEITPCLRQCSRRCGRFPVLHRWG